MFPPLHSSEICGSIFEKPTKYDLRTLPSMSKKEKECDLFIKIRAYVSMRDCVFVKGSQI